jgi:hypothetical protein
MALYKKSAHVMHFLCIVECSLGKYEYSVSKYYDISIHLISITV